MRHRLSQTLLSSVALLCGSSADAATSALAPPTAYLQDVQRSAHARAANASAADDIVGEVTLRLWRRHREIVESYDASKAAYLQRCVHNRVRDEWRSQKRRTAFSETSGADGDDALGSVAVATDPLELASVNEFRDALSPDDRGVLELLEQGCSERDIASVTRQTRHQVRKSLSRIARDAERHLV